MHIGKALNKKFDACINVMAYILRHLYMLLSIIYLDDNNVITFVFYFQSDVPFLVLVNYHSFLKFVFAV
jgi:hypothetical protein